MFLAFIKRRWPLFVVLIVFVILKFPHLYFSFYWDESWPYASGVYKMYQNGLSLLPGAIDGELSRGHPLLFHFLGASWMKVFGTSVFSLHSFALFISVLLLVLMYEVCLSLFGFRVAVLSVILISFQQMFFVQSAFVLLEIQLALCALAALYFYVSNYFIATAIALSMLFYTKESGIILGAVLGIDALIKLQNKEEFFKIRLYRLISLAFPFLTIVLFFVLQKQISGWYVLPLYTQGFEKYWPSFFDKFRRAFRTVFMDDFRNYLYLLLFALIIIAAILKKNKQYLLPSIFGFVVLLMTCSRLNSVMSSVLLCILIFISLVILLRNAAYHVGASKPASLSFIRLSVIFAILFFAFTAYNLFYIDRYILIAIMPVTVVTAYYFDVYIQYINRKLFLPLFAVVLLIQVSVFKNSDGIGDNRLGAFDGAAVHQEVVDYLERNKLYDTPIASGGFLNRIHLTDPNTRFLSTNDTFSQVSWDIFPQTQFVIFDNIEIDERRENISNSPDWMLHHKIEVGKAWSEIYKRKTP